MNKQYLWLVTLDEITQWSTYSTAVVVAQTEDKARRVLPTSKALSGPSTWCCAEYVSVRYLGIAEPGLEGVICVYTPNESENDKGE